MPMGAQTRTTQRKNVSKGMPSGPNPNPKSKQYFSPKVKNSGGSGNPKPISGKATPLCK